MLLQIIVLLSLTFIEGRKGYGPGDQEWGYVTVHPHRHMFYWLHYTTADPVYTERPLLIWLQGGPASSATGEGNILNSGLVDMDLNIRDYSYVNKANVLYIDSPVGAGYSYVDVEAGGTFAPSCDDVTKDFIEFLERFLQKYPEFKTVPLYLLGESYGGKFAALFGERLLQKINEGKNEANFKGVGLAYPAIDYATYCHTIGEYLYQAGIVDGDGLTEINHLANSIVEATNTSNLVEGNMLMEALLVHLMDTYQLPIFSIPGLKKNSEEFPSNFYDFMDNTISPLLNLTVRFAAQRKSAAEAILDKLKPATSSVEYLLDSHKKVFIYNGQLDWLVTTNATLSWVENLQWYGYDRWPSTPRRPLYVNGVHEGHKKQCNNLEFYWIKRAGHRLPDHNPKAMDYIIKRLIEHP